LYELNTANKTINKLSIMGTVPDPRYGHSSCTVGNNLYIYGGCILMNTANYVPSDELWQFSYDTKSWNRVQSQGVSPQGLYHATLSSINNTSLFLYAGLDLDNITKGELYQFNIANSTWKKLYLIDEHEKRFAHSAVTLGNIIFIFGGASYSPKKVFNDIYMLNTMDNEKTKEISFENIPVNNWTVEHVCAWLTKISSSWQPYHKIFIEKSITGSVLLEMTQQDLKEELGITTFGHLKLLYKNICDLKNKSQNK